MTEFPEIERLRAQSTGWAGYARSVPLADAERAVRDAVKRVQGETVGVYGIANAARNQAVRECVEALLMEADVQRYCGEGDAADTYVAAASLLTMLGGEDAR
jgi:hypothetical protein